MPKLTWQVKARIFKALSYVMDKSIEDKAPDYFFITCQNLYGALDTKSDLSYANYYFDIALILSAYDIHSAVMYLDLANIKLKNAPDAKLSRRIKFASSVIKLRKLENANIIYQKPLKIYLDIKNLISNYEKNYKNEYYLLEKYNKSKTMDFLFRALIDSIPDPEFIEIMIMPFSDILLELVSFETIKLLDKKVIRKNKNSILGPLIKTQLNVLNASALVEKDNIELSDAKALEQLKLAFDVSMYFNLYNCGACAYISAIVYYENKDYDKALEFFKLAVDNIYIDSEGFEYVAEQYINVLSSLKQSGKAYRFFKSIINKFKKNLEGKMKIYMPMLNCMLDNYEEKYLDEIILVMSQFQNYLESIKYRVRRSYTKFEDLLKFKLKLYYKINDINKIIDTYHECNKYYGSYLFSPKNSIELMNEIVDYIYKQKLFDISFFSDLNNISIKNYTSIENINDILETNEEYEIELVNEKGISYLFELKDIHEKDESEYVVVLPKYPKLETFHIMMFKIIYKDTGYYLEYTTDIAIYKSYFSQLFDCVW